MKRFLSLAAAIILTAGLCLMQTVNVSAVGGSGTESDPYLISNEEEFQLIKDFPSSSFKLIQNIVLNSSFSIVADFSGTIDGNGCIVVGLDGSGLIYNNNGNIKNLIVEVDELSFSFVSENNGTIENCGIVGGEVTTRTGNAGTFAITNNGTIRNCFSQTQLTVAGMASSSSVGGFVGQNNGTIENCLYLGHIYLKGTTTNGDKLNKYVSAFVGDNTKSSSEWVNDGGTVTGCFYDRDEAEDASKSSGGASGKSSTALKMQATYADWDFSSIWAIDSSKNDGYPYLQCDRRFNGQALPAITPTPAPTQAPTPVPTSAPTAVPTPVPTQEVPSISVTNTPNPQPDGITVNLENSPISFDQPPIILNDRTMVPLRAIFEALGAEVQWNGENKTIYAARDDREVFMEIDEPTMIVGVNFAISKLIAETLKTAEDISIIELDMAPIIVNDRTLVPVRAIAEAFECTVEWDGTTKTVDIYKSKTSSKPVSSSNTGSTASAEPVKCSVCGGDGRVLCTYCNGTGQGLSISIMGVETPQGCTYCGSAGWRVCGNCGGSGQI